VKRAYDVLIEGLAGFAGLLIAAMCGLIVWDVAARNFGLQPPASTVALTEYGLLYFTMAAAPWLVRQRGHIVVEVFYQRVPEGWRSWLDRFVLTICVLVCSAVAVLASLLTWEAAVRGEFDMRSLDTPRWVLFAPLAVGFALMALEYLRLLLTGRVGLRH
jgi:C4-dicarboxylate transporter DctQ subunit